MLSYEPRKPIPWTSWRLLEKFLACCAVKGAVFAAHNGLLHSTQPVRSYLSLCEPPHTRGLGAADSVSSPSFGGH